MHLGELLAFIDTPISCVDSSLEKAPTSPFLHKSFGLDSSFFQGNEVCPV